MASIGRYYLFECLFEWLVEDISVDECVERLNDHLLFVLAPLSPTMRSTNSSIQGFNNTHTSVMTRMVSSRSTTATPGLDALGGYIDASCSE